MREQLIVINEDSGLDALETYLVDKEYVAIDCETTGLTKRDEVIGFSIAADEQCAFYVIIKEWSAEEKLLRPRNYGANRITRLLASLQFKQLIGHNFVFDAMMIESNFKISLIQSLHTDTMILAHLLDENRRVGLKELAATMFSIKSTTEAQEMKASVLANGGIITKDKYEMYKADSHLLAKYGAKDALLTYKLFTQLIPELCEQKLDTFFFEESMPLLKGPTYDLNVTGLQVDTKALTTLKATLVAECAEAKSFITSEITPHIIHKYPGTSKKNLFNIGSNQQLSWLLFGKLNLEFNTLTKAGKEVCKSLGLRLPYTRSAKTDFINTCLNAEGQVYSPEGTINGKKVRAKKVKEPWCYIAVDKGTLKKLAPKYKWIAALLDYQRKNKMLNTYVEGLESRIQYGVIHPSYLQHGTSSGRYSSRNPNFQNLPRDDQRIKECIVARPGKVFVSADYSQLEPRVFAFYSGDKRLMEAFDGTTDFYSVIGIEIYDKHDALPIKDGHPNAFGVKYKKLRDSIKTIALARAYGATPPQLAKTLDKSIEDTADDIAKYDERFPGVRSQMLEAHKLAKTNGYVTSLFGRPRRIPEAKRIVELYGNADHEELPYEARQLLNLSCNHRIQSTGASIINRAMIEFYKLTPEAGLDSAKIVSQVHDELIVECNQQDADNVALLLQHCMENTNTLPGVPLEAIPRITKTLAK